MANRRAYETDVPRNIHGRKENDRGPRRACRREHRQHHDKRGSLYDIEQGITCTQTPRTHIHTYLPHSDAPLFLSSLCAEFSDAIDANDKDAVQLWAALAKADDQSALGKLLKSVAPNKLDIKKAKEIKKKLPSF